MLQYLEAHVNTIYAITFVSVMLVIVSWEGLAPRRQPVYSCWIRWLGNFGIFVLNAFILQLLLPLTAVAFATTVAKHGWGLFNNIAAPLPIAIIVSMVILDGLHYCKHVVFHKIPLLWRFHRMHHTDLDYDFTTGIRFHPFESIVNAIINLAAIVVLGMPAVAVIVFELTLVLVTLTVHGNINYSAMFDKVFRTLLVTPDMHRIHHSARVSETDSNYGVIFSWWDRLCATHVAQPLNGHEGMTLGLLEFRDDKHQALPWMLACPFLSSVGTAHSQHTKVGLDE